MQVRSQRKRREMPLKTSRSGRCVDQRGYGSSVLDDTYFDYKFKTVDNLRRRKRKAPSPRASNSGSSHDRPPGSDRIRCKAHPASSRSPSTSSFMLPADIRARITSFAILSSWTSAKWRDPVTKIVGTTRGLEDMGHRLVASRQDFGKWWSDVAGSGAGESWLVPKQARPQVLSRCRRGKVETKANSGVLKRSFVTI